MLMPDRLDRGQACPLRYKITNDDPRQPARYARLGVRVERASMAMGYAELRGR
jgi:hypothetical protein